MALLRSAQVALSTSYPVSSLVVEAGWENVSVTLDDATIAFTVRMDGAGVENVPAGSSWGIATPGSTKEALGLEIKAASGTPNASVIWFK